MEVVVDKIPNTIDVIDKLRWNAHLGKHSHFFASKRGRHLHILYGVPIVLINFLLGSFLFTALGNELPKEIYWVGAMLAFIAAALGGVQTFFDFKKDYQGHRRIGNEYLSIAREAEGIIATYFDDLMELHQLTAEIASLNKRYSEINQMAEDFLVPDSAYRRALAVQTRKADKEPSLVERMRAQEQ
jgi:hypothetical protein